MPLKAAELSQVLSDLVEAVGPSIVRVEGGRRRAATGIVTAKGRVVTAAHVLRAERVEVVRDGEVYAARVKGLDATTDLALLEVEGDLPPITWDDGAAAKVGQVVLQLGRPGETVRATAGIISARSERQWTSPAGGDIDSYLEADAPHQPGFSGGPLLSLSGAVLGVMTTGLLRHTSLAVPAATVQRVAAQLEQHGRRRASYLGASLQPLVLPRPVQADTGEEVGLLVVAVAPGGPAARAGVRYGDTLLHLGDDTVRTLDDLQRYLRADHSGETVPVKLYRGGAVETVSVVLGARP